MKSELSRINHIDARKIIVWGCKAFENFECHFLKKYGDKQRLEGPLKSNGAITAFGYAAAFPDPEMVASEVNFVKKLARELSNHLPDSLILFRPYPIVDKDLYLPLKNERNIEVVEIEGNIVDRYGDGRELIKYGTYDEKINYLNGCDIFLSLGTSFSIEASICRVPMIQLSISKNERNTWYERAIFERLDISDHIQNYFVNQLRTAKSYADLLKFIDSILEDQGLYNDYEFQNKLGLPANIHSINEDILKQKIDARE